MHAAGLKPHRRGVSFNEKSIKVTPHKINAITNKIRLDSFTIHIADLKSMFEACGNPNSLKLIAQPDTHTEYVDLNAINCFIKFIEWYEPHVHVILGDFLDAEGISHWPSSDRNPRRFVPEVIKARELLKREVNATPGCKFRFFIVGNHCLWLEMAIAQKLPELFDGIDELGLDLNISKLLDLEKFGFQEIPFNHFLRIGKANFTHGIYTTDNHPKKHLEVVKDNIYYGHLHDTKSYNSTTMNGPIEAASLGCLCRLDAKFLKGRPNTWVHAFGIFEFFRDGSYSFYCPKIINGKLSFMGKIFE